MCHLKVFHPKTFHPKIYHLKTFHPLIECKYKIMIFSVLSLIYAIMNHPRCTLHNLLCLRFPVKNWGRPCLPTFALKAPYSKTKATSGFQVKKWEGRILCPVERVKCLRVKYLMVKWLGWNAELPFVGVWLRYTWE